VTALLPRIVKKELSTQSALAIWCSRSRRRAADDPHRVPRIARGAATTPVRETGSSVYQVFDGSGVVTVGDNTWSVTCGDLFVVPSWRPFSVRSEAGRSDSDSGALDLFRFSDTPVFEALRLNRIQKDA
jgi:gentisate 1,2-dioxygenase